MKNSSDQLCTLLITFQDPVNPVKQITTAHAFNSTDPRHYPQKRRVVHSQQEDDSIDSGAYMTVSRSASSTVGGLGSDMVEKGPIGYLKGGGRQIIIQEVRLCYTKEIKEALRPPVALPRVGPLRIDYTTTDFDRNVQHRAAIADSAAYLASAKSGHVREASKESGREAQRSTYVGDPIKITIETGYGGQTPTPPHPIAATAASKVDTRKTDTRAPPGPSTLPTSKTGSEMPTYRTPPPGPPLDPYEKYSEEYARNIQEGRTTNEKFLKESMMKKTSYVKQIPAQSPQGRDGQKESSKPIVVPISREVPIRNGFGGKEGYQKEDIRLYARYDDRSRGQISPDQTSIKRPRIIDDHQQYPIKIPVTITSSAPTSPPLPTSPPPSRHQPRVEPQLQPPPVVHETPRGRYTREEAYYRHEEYYRKTKKPVIKPQIIPFGSAYNFAQVRQDQSREAEVVHQARPIVIPQKSRIVEIVESRDSSETRKSQEAQQPPRVVESEFTRREEPQQPRGLRRTHFPEVEESPPPVELQPRGLPRTHVEHAELIDYETYRREVEELKKRAAEVERIEPRVDPGPRPTEIDPLEVQQEAIRRAEARKQAIKETIVKSIEEFGMEYMETRERVEARKTPRAETRFGVEEQQETRFGVVKTPEPEAIQRASPARIVDETIQHAKAVISSPPISRVASPESRTSTPSTYPIKSPPIKSPEPVKSPPPPAPRRVEEFSAEILQKYEEFAKHHAPRSKSHERPKEVREAERRAKDYPVRKQETLEILQKRDEIASRSGVTSFPPHARTPYPTPCEAQPAAQLVTPYTTMFTGRHPLVTKTRETIEREFREKVEIVEKSRAFKKYGIPLSPMSPTGSKVQDTIKRFERDEAEVSTSRGSISTPSPRPTFEVPTSERSRLEITEIRDQITETLKKVEEKIKPHPQPPPPTPATPIVATRMERVEETRTEISQEELEERLRQLRPLPIKETSDQSTQASEAKPSTTEIFTQMTPIAPPPPPETLHIGTQDERPTSSSIGTQPEPVRTAEISTQHEQTEYAESTTEPEVVESYEVGTQAELESPEFRLEDISDRQLRELLRRECQIEDIVDIDVVRRQRIRDERDRDLEPLVTEPELEVIHEVEEEVEEAREAERRETPMPIPSLRETRPTGEEEEDESRFEERVDETVTRTMATVEKKRTTMAKKTSPPTTPTSKTATTAPKTTTTATAELKLQPEIGDTTTETTTTRRMEYYTPEYRSTITPRSGLVRESRTISPASTTRMLKVVSETSSISGGLLSPYGSTAAATIRDAREREKKEMSDLNDRLASYIEKVRFLEAQNRKLAADLDFLRNRWGRDTHSIRDMYESELKQARKVLEDANRERDDLEKQIKILHDEIGTYRRKYEEAARHRDGDKKIIDDLLIKLAALESEVDLLRRRIANLEDDVSSTKRENVRLMNDLQRARMDLDQETLNRIDYQNQVQTLLEEVEFLRRAHEQEIRDLQAMASRDTTSENREYFKNELASAIREIREEYEQLTNVQRTDMESWYKLKVQEIQTQSARQTMEQSYAKEEIKRLRVQLGDLRGKLADLEGRNSLLEKQIEELNYQLEDDQRSYEAALNDRDSQIRKIRDECQALMVELQMLLDTKQTLDAEIAIYRKMLEGEEDRAGLRQLVEQVVRTHQFKETQETDTMRVIKGETASRSSYQRSAKGNVSILEAANDGKYVIIENTHRSKEEDIGEWKLKRRLDGKRDLVFTFSRDFVLKPGKTVKIWARGHGVYNPPDQLVYDAEDSWGTGHNVHTILYNTQGEERATLIQRSSHTTTGH